MSGSTDTQAEIVRLQAEVASLRRERDAALARVRQTDDWFRQLAESMPLLVFAARPDGVVDFVNPAFWAFIGREPDQEALEAGHWLLDLHPDDQGPTAHAWATAVESGEQFGIAYRIRRHDGQYRWHDVLAYPVRDEGGIVAWFGAAADVHDRRLAEVALADREERLRAIFEHGPDAISVVSADGVIREINPAGWALLGADGPEAVIGSYALAQVHPDDLERHRRVVDEVLAGRAARGITRLIRRDGTIRWVETYSVPLAEADDDRSRSVLSVTRDVSDRHRQQVIERAGATVHAGLLAGERLEVLLETITTALDEIIEGYSAVLLVDEGRFRGGTAPGLPDGFLAGVTGLALDPDHCPANSDGTFEHPVTADDLHDSSGWRSVAEILAEAGFSSGMPYPVFDASGAVMAVLAVYRRDARPPTADEELVLARASRLIGLAIERVRNDVSLRRATRALQVACRLGRLGGWSMDVPTTEVVWSDEVAAIHGRPRGYRPGIEEGVSYYAPEHRTRIIEAFTNCVREGTPFDLEAELIDVDGVRKWCRVVAEADDEADGRIRRITGSLQDITEAKRSVEALRGSEERFRLLARATSDVVFDWDLEAGEVWYGEGRDDLFGDERGPVVPAAHVIQRAHADDRERVERRFTDLIRNGGDRWSDEFRVIRSDGSRVPVRGSGFVLRDVDGRATRIIGSLVDVTVEHELQGQLAQAHRLEAVGQLTGGVAHDFNNLLTVIMGNLDLLAADLDAPEPPDRDELLVAVETIGTAAHRGAELTKQLLAFARRQPLDPVAIDVPSMLQRLGELLRRTLGEDIQVLITVDEAVGAALADVAQLDSALLNVCINARDAMPGGGVLTIEVDDVQVEPAQTADGDGVEPGEYVVISITDSGSGMPPEVADRVFDPFFSTKAPGRGTGLGLSMVYGFAKQSGGQVEIDSRLGRGTTVRIWLPAASGDGPVELPGTRTGPAGRGGRERILVVEDEELVREIVAAQLRTLGYEVVEAADGPSALALVRDGRPIDLLFTDVVMPGGLNGFELAEALATVDPGVPVLLSSGYADEALVRHGGLGGDRSGRPWSMLPKPYRFADLAAQVRAAIDARISAG